MAKNINSLQLLRNTKQLYATKDAAISGITGTATNDGTVKLARYKETVTSGNTQVEVIKTIFGIYSIGSEISGSSVTGGSYTIYDSPQEVIEALEKRVKANKAAIDTNKTDIATNKAAIATLNGADTVEGSVSKKIKDAIEGLDATVTSTTGETFVKVQVVETDGKITAVNVTENDIASAKLLGTTASNSGETSAFGYIAKEAANRATAITAAINALNVIDTAVSGSYVSEVSETNGKIAVSRVALPTVAEIKSEGQAIVSVKEDKGVISATVGDIAATHVTIADAAGHFTAGTVEAALEELFSQAGSGSQVTVSEAAGTEGILKVYTINQGGKAVGTINIPKDLVVTSGSVVKGNWSGEVFTESASGTGTALKLVIANQTKPVYINTLDLVKDHIGGNGINISDTNVVSVVVDTSGEFLSVGANGVKVSGVKTYVGEEIAKLSGETTSTGGNHVTVKVNEKAGKITTVTVSESDIASANLLGTTDSTSGETSAFGYIAKEVAERKAAIQTQKNALDAEIAARKAVDGQSGATYSANTTATYISGATSLNDADVKLNAAIEANKTAIEASLANEKTARETEDKNIVSGVGLTVVDGVYKIAANSGTGEYISAASTVKQAIYTLDDAITAAKKANTLVKGDNTVVVEKVASGETAGNTSVRVNIASAETVTNFVGYASDGSFIKSNMFGTIDAGTY